MGHIDNLTASLEAPDRLHAGMLLPVARYRFRFRMDTGVRLPEYAGSLLRGQFGAALRRTACMTGAKTCVGCPLRRTCPYPAIFETPAPEPRQLPQFSSSFEQVPNPYVIEPPPFGTRWTGAGEMFEFGVVLIGHAIEQLPLIAFALQRAFGRGIGRELAKGELEDIDWELDGEMTSVWDSETGSIVPHDVRLRVPSLAQCRQAKLQINTPLRLQLNGHPLSPQEVTPRKLLTALTRRASLLLAVHAGMAGIVGDAKALAAQAEALADSRMLRWKEWTRYSSRQQQEMTLGGVVGEWALEGDLGPLAHWLWLGQWLHVGKNATMGMGRYTLSIS